MMTTKSVHVAIGSTNPAKIEAVRLAFTKSFPEVDFVFEGVSVESGVGHQPWGISETWMGAKTRADNAQIALPNAEYSVGLEGGVEDVEDGLMACAWMVIRQVSTGVYGKAQTAHFMLPDEVVRLVKEGIELGHADDIVFGRTNSKQTNGACGILTDDIITRSTLYEHALLLALIPFRPKNAKLYHAASMY